MKATKEQFQAYTRVQSSGNYNMFSPDAILSTGLDKETYFDIIEHYEEYTEKYEGENNG